jgi:prophage regulatory protein
MVRQTQTPADTSDRVINTRELLDLIPLTRSTIWKLAREGRFPKPIQLTPSRIGWQLSEVLAWVADRKRNPIPAHVNAPRRQKAS